MGKAPPQSIIVVGAGIVGASLAYHLASKGASVLVVEAEDIACGASGRSFGWINTSYVGNDPIAALRGAAIQAYRHLQAQVPGLHVRWTGALCYHAPPDDGAQPVAPASAQRLVDRMEIHALEPRLRHPPQQALYAPEQGALDAVAATRTLIAAAQAHGARLMTRTPVLRLLAEGTQVTGVATDSATLKADLVVLAAGTGIPALAEPLGVALPIGASPALFMRYSAQPQRVNTIISSPTVEVRQQADGTLLAAEDYVDDSVENQPAAVASRTARAIHAALEGVELPETQWACVGLRPMPVDRIPIIGHLPQATGIYVCTMHPGVTLAAIAGRLASDEIIDGQPSPALEPCRPARFFAKHST